MKVNGQKAEKIRKALVFAYKEREKSELGHEWQGRVMASVRRLGITDQKQVYREYFERLVWRLAPVAVALILILATVIAQFDFVSDFELTNIFIEESADFSLLPSLET